MARSENTGDADPALAAQPIESEGAGLLRRASKLRESLANEEALAAYRRAATWGREHGDRRTEGLAELAMHDLQESMTAPGQLRDALRHDHATRAEAAFAATGDRRNLAEALARLVGGAVDSGDVAALPRQLTRLERINPAWGRWWRRYAEAMTTDDLQVRVDGLTWCRDRADLMDDHAAHWRRQCDAKLALLTGRRTPVDDDATVAQRADAAAFAAIEAATWPEVSDQEAPARLRAALADVELLRRRVRSPSKQRELSNAYQLPYTAASFLFDRAGRIEELFNVLELNSSRSLSCHEAMAALWRGRRDPVRLAYELDSGRSLERLLGRYRSRPTPYNRRLLVVTFGRLRDKLYEAEQRLIEAAGDKAPAAPATAADVRQVLAADDVVVRFTTFGSVIALDRTGARHVACFDPKEVYPACEALHAAMSDPARGPAPDAYRRASATLTRALVDPVRAVAPEGGRVFVIPSSSIWRIPLAVVGERPLAADRRVGYVPNLTILRRLLTEPRPRRRIERFVGVGDPDGTLPHARTEVERAAGCFGDGLTFVGDAYKAASARANIAVADVVHLSCHGFHFPDYPDFSGLHLAGSTEDPGMWWYHDLARFDLTAHLVVLAACHAGTGTTTEGSEYIGLPGGFLSAGAGTVLAPLWAVDDRSTASLMGRFYPALLRTGSAARALWEVQSGADPDRVGRWAAPQIFGLP